MKNSKAQVGLIIGLLIFWAVVSGYIVSISTSSGQFRYFTNGVEVTGVMRNPFAQSLMLAVMLTALTMGLINLAIWCVDERNRRRARCAAMAPGERRDHATRNLATRAVFIVCLGFTLFMIVGAAIDQTTGLAIMLGMNGLGALLGIVSLIRSGLHHTDVYRRAVVAIVLAIALTPAPIVMLMRNLK